MKVVVDTLGGDKGLKEVVKGAIEALLVRDDFSIVLSGPENEIQEALKEYKYDESRVEIINGPTEISCDEAPVEAIRKKGDSSLVVAYKYLKENEDTALVSVGSTGAVLAGGIFKLGRLKGVKRPALAPLIPTLTDGKVMLMDSGANVDCDPENLEQFAIMASAYMEKVEKIDMPRVALICNGTEDAKGCNLSKETFKLLANNDNINFVGNMEARDMVSGNYDVLIADGFDGNIALKALEGGAKVVSTLLKKEIKSSFMAKIGYLFMRKSLKRMKAKIDFNKIGGAVLMGLEKVVIKGHGASDAECVKVCIIQAINAISNGVVKAVGEKIGQVNKDGNI